jgi:hypothetical protein
MSRRKERGPSVANAPESHEVKHKTDDEMFLISDVTRMGPAESRALMYNNSLDDPSTTIPPVDTEKSTAFLVTNWLVVEGEG